MGFSVLRISLQMSSLFEQPEGSHTVDLEISVALILDSLDFFPVDFILIDFFSLLSASLSSSIFPFDSLSFSMRCRLSVSDAQMCTNSHYLTRDSYTDQQRDCNPLWQHGETQTTRQSSTTFISAAMLVLWLSLKDKTSLFLPVSLSLSEELKLASQKSQLLEEVTQLKHFSAQISCSLNTPWQKQLLDQISIFAVQDVEWFLTPPINPDMGFDWIGFGKVSIDPMLLLHS